jgi:hypothetical protein
MGSKKTKTLLDTNAISRFIAAVEDPKRISGLTHTFYRYPARFSPVFARAAIELFTDVGDVVLDPFMGGATTLVEASSLGRIGVGLDVSELSCFLARVKTKGLAEAEIAAVRSWMAQTLKCLNVRNQVPRPQEWINQGYQRNLDNQGTWRIRKLIEIALSRIKFLRDLTSQEFIRAVILRTAQWALDCKKSIPSTSEFRKKLGIFLEEMVAGSVEYRESFGKCFARGFKDAVVILNGSAADLDDLGPAQKYGPPRLILTSPPYPGVHVLYHRWQIMGRRETPAPFWIANAQDGSGLSFYSFGDRKAPGLNSYFEQARLSFKAIAQIAKKDTLIVQMIAFSEPKSQLPRYLEVMKDVGLEEVSQLSMDTDDGRLWRTVPNRKWYAQQRSSPRASHEVVLFHRKSTK